MSFASCFNSLFLILFLISYGLQFTFFKSFSYASDELIRPFLSVRSAGMGGVNLTTGLYDENFFYNPARITANPESKFTIIDILPVEINPSTINLLSSASQNSSTTSILNNFSGKNLHLRTQIILPAYYLASNETRKFALAIGIISNFQLNGMIGQNYQANLLNILDIGPAITYGRKFLQNNSLSVGVTARLMYRAGSNQSYSLFDYFQETTFSPNSFLSDGAMINADLGATYKITKIGTFDLSAAAAIQNITNAPYSPKLFSVFKQGSIPPSQNRTYGLGLALTRATWRNFSNISFALEVSDIQNNPNSSFFTLLHIGSEITWKKLALRLGINQGYWTAGLGLDLHYFTLNLASYGEELGLNAGMYEDRRFLLNFGFHI